MRGSAGATLSVLVSGILVGCGSFRRVSPPAPAPPAAPRVDTVTLTVAREVSPALPGGTPAEICLATGLSLQIQIASSGDTLVGPRRVPLRELQPGLAFEGRYADGQAWFAKAEPIRFERRDYRKLDQPVALKCEDLKRVGEHNGIPFFADIMVLSPIETILVPVGPGRFQPYRTTPPKR